MHVCVCVRVVQVCAHMLLNIIWGFFRAMRKELWFGAEDASDHILRGKADLGETKFFLSCTPLQNMHRVPTTCLMQW